jgi:hypothetical protein
VNLNRRDAMLRLGQLGIGGLTLPHLLEAQAFSRSENRSTSADALIYVFLWGGPPQQDMWDMKPEAPTEIRSPFGSIGTKTPGLRICDQMPLFAKQTDKVALIRSLSHDSNNHEPSVYRMLTGRVNNRLVVPSNQRKRSDFPNLASIVSQLSGPREIPCSVTIPRPIGHDGVTYSGTHAGFLGPKHDPIERLAANRSNEPAMHSASTAPDLTSERLLGRETLRKQLERLDSELQKGALKELNEFRNQALQMIAAPKVREAFNLESESPALRDRYGRNEYGDCFLMARRLVEAGIKVISIAWMFVARDGKVANVWDNHGNIANLGNLTGFDMLKAEYCLPPLDRGLSALLEDLQNRGMLDRTMIAVAGEFGRTPKINPHGGREHWGACQSVLLAGGGIRGGQVFGASDKIAAYPTRDAISPEDYLATIYHALGIDPNSEILDREGRPQRVVEGRAIRELF